MINLQKNFKLRQMGHLKALEPHITQIAIKVMKGYGVREFIMEKALSTIPMVKFNLKESIMKVKKTDKEIYMLKMAKKDMLVTGRMISIMEKVKNIMKMVV